MKICFESVKSVSSVFDCQIFLNYTLINIPKIKHKKKETHFCISFRGIVRIRTGVGAFAEPSLAARPRRH